MYFKISKKISRKKNTADHTKQIMDHGRDKGNICCSLTQDFHTKKRHFFWCNTFQFHRGPKQGAPGIYDDEERKKKKNWLDIEQQFDFLLELVSLQPNVCVETLSFSALQVKEVNFVLSRTSTTLLSLKPFEELSQLSFHGITFENEQSEDDIAEFNQSLVHLYCRQQQTRLICLSLYITDLNYIGKSLYDILSSPNQILEYVRLHRDNKSSSSTNNVSIHTIPEMVMEMLVNGLTHPNCKVNSFDIGGCDGTRIHLFEKLFSANLTIRDFRLDVPITNNIHQYWDLDSSNRLRNALKKSVVRFIDFLNHPLFELWSEEFVRIVSQEKFKVKLLILSVQMKKRTQHPTPLLRLLPNELIALIAKNIP